MFGYTIVKKSYIDTINGNLGSLRESLRKETRRLAEAENDSKEKSGAIYKLNNDLRDKDAHILKLGESLSEARELYQKSVAEKNDLKKAVMDLERKLKGDKAVIRDLSKENEALKNAIKEFKEFKKHRDEMASEAMGEKEPAHTDTFETDSTEEDVSVDTEKVEVVYTDISDTDNTENEDTGSIIHEEEPKDESFPEGVKEASEDAGESPEVFLGTPSVERKPSKKIHPKKKKK